MHILSQKELTEKYGSSFSSRLVDDQDSTIATNNCMHHPISLFIYLFSVTSCSIKVARSNYLLVMLVIL